MSTAADAAKTRPIGLRQLSPPERDGHSARHEPRALTDLMQSIALLEASCRVESDLAQTLRAMAAHRHSEAEARLLRLAEDASRGARAAAKTSESLRQHARQREDHDDDLALRQALDHIAWVIAELARGANDITGILTALADANDPDLTARRRQLASGASSAAQHARDLAQTLHLLAQADGGKTESDGTSAANPATDRAPIQLSTPRRLPEVDQRLTELRQAKLTTEPGDRQDLSAGPEAVRRARLAYRHYEESVAHLREARQLSVAALDRAASAHDRAAEAYARSARAGIGDVAEHRRMAAFHEAAANADRQKAEKISDDTRDEGADPAENLTKATVASS